MQSDTFRRFAKRKASEETLGGVINNLIDAYKLRGKLDEVSVVNQLHEIFPPVISKEFAFIRLSGENLEIRITSPLVKQEFRIGQTAIVEQLNQKLGSGRIKQIILI